MSQMDEKDQLATVKVNGKPITVSLLTPDWRGQPAPTTIMQACILAGVEVPHFCYHPKLPIAGNCRMCLVEVGFPVKDSNGKLVLNPDGTPKVQKSPRPVIACATPITPGMEIYTDTPAVKQMRTGILEFLLANHPLDCPICDQAGECTLQEHVVAYGRDSSRFNETKLHKPKAVQLGPRVMYDAERCILCTRCIRFTREIVGDDVLGIINRGARSMIAVYPGKKFDNNYTLNTVDICPVGALTSVDFRFRMRVWFLKETPSICPGCSTGCNITIWSRQNVIYRITPRQNDEVNGPWMCDHGRFQYKLTQSPTRLVRPTVNGTSISPQHAVEYVANFLRKNSSKQAAIIASGQLSTEELWLVAKLKSLLNCTSDILVAQGPHDHLLLSSDRNPNTQGAILTGVCYSEVGLYIPKIIHDIEVGRVKILFVFGENTQVPELTQPILGKLDLLVVYDVVRTALTDQAHVVFPGATFAEKTGTFINKSGRIQKFFQAVEPPSEARPAYIWINNLLACLNGKKLGTQPEEIFNSMKDDIPAIKNLHWDQIGMTGVQIHSKP